MRLLLLLSITILALAAADDTTSDSTPSTSTSPAPSPETTSAATESSTASPAADTTTSPAAAASTETTVTAASSPTVVTNTPASTAQSTEQTQNTPAAETGTTPSPGPAVTTTAEVTTEEPTTTVTIPKTQFSVNCVDKMCTYEMAVPGLDLDTFHSLEDTINKDSTQLHGFEFTALPTLQADVTKEVSVIQGQLADLEASVDALNQTIIGVSAVVDAIDGYIADMRVQNSISAALINTLSTKGRNTCYYKKCIDKSTTLPPTTTTVLPTTTTLDPCASSPCVNNGSCYKYGGGYRCSCQGNLDGITQNCATSNCAYPAEASSPGVIISPGSFTNSTWNGYEDSLTCRWTISSSDNTKLMVDPDAPAMSVDLDPTAILQVQVGSSKLKITGKTTAAMLNFILGRGPTATITFTTSTAYDGHFFFTLK